MDTKTQVSPEAEAAWDQIALILRFARQGFSAQEIRTFTNEPLARVEAIIEQYIRRHDH